MLEIEDSARPKVRVVSRINIGRVFRRHAGNGLAMPMELSLV